MTPTTNGGTCERRGWAVVTGATGEIGSVVAEQLGRDGHDVIVQCFRKVERAEQVAAATERHGGRAVVVRANFAAAGAACAFVEEVRAITGEVRTLVAAAASGVMRPVAELSERHWDWTMSVNVRSLATLVSQLRPVATVALSSAGASRAVAGYAAVGASKAAMEALVRSLAVELAPAGRVNALCVGLMDSPAARLLPDAVQVLDDMRDRTPLGRLVTAQDVAQAITWMLSDDASMLTGATVVLDGGRSILL